MAAILKPDGTREQRDKISFKECQEAVGGFVEPVYLRGKTLLANEDGPSLGLQLNQEATKLAGRRIVGTVVVLEAGAETELVLGGPDED